MKSIQRRFFLAMGALLCHCALARPAEIQTALGSAYQLPNYLDSYDATMPSAGSSAGLSPVTVTPNNLGTFSIVIVPNASLASNTAALAAFNRAAAQWASRISDPITVTINAGLATSVELGNGVLGSTNSVTLSGGYTTVRNALIADSQADDSIVASLPTTFSATMPSGFTLSPNVVATKANFKAMGFTGLDTMFGVSDGTITFNSDFAFDYDNSPITGGGLSPSSYDFETVAAHEIGHLLGFISAVDDIDYAIANSITGSVAPTALDLFRFADTNNPATDPNNAATFTSATRNLVPGAVGITDFGTDTWGIGTEFKMSTGSFNGDGRQASHWKDSLGIGIMDPTLGLNEISPITEADFRAFDLIGWDIAPIPEPSTYALGVTGLAACYWFHRRRAA